jgi:ComF family protein
MRAAQYALDTVAPPDPLIREIENMTPAEFERRVSGPISRRPDGTTAFFPYRSETMRTALVELKDFRNGKIERLIGMLMRDRLIEMLNGPEGFSRKGGATRARPETHLLVPVPMTKKALRKRGWNQCELIAREISKADGEKRMETRTDVLRKTRDTGDQVGKTREERLASLESCMKVENDIEVRGRNVIVIEDIVTTGATLGEAKRALLQAGARAVICVAVAF